MLERPRYARYVTKEQRTTTCTTALRNLNGNLVGLLYMLILAILNAVMRRMLHYKVDEALKVDPRVSLAMEYSYWFSE